MHPRLSPLPSSTANQQPPATTLAAASSSITPPHPTSTAVSVKQETCHPATSGQNNQFAKAVITNTDAPQVHLNQPVPFYPSNLLSPLLLTPLHLAAPTTSAASASVNTLQETSEGLEDCVKKVRSAQGQAQPAISDSEEETVGNHGKEEVKGKNAAAGKNASAAATDSDDGSESDDSVKMMEPSNLVVIDIDESDNEDTHKTISNVSVHSEPPQMSASPDFSSASTQTSQQVDDDK